MGGGRDIASPVADNEMIYLGNEKRSDGGGILFAVKAGAEGDITPDEGASTSSGVAWSLPGSGMEMASPLLYEGLLYIVERRRGMIFCYNADTGEPVYQSTKIPDAGPFWASPWAVDGRIYCMDERGTTHVIRAGDEFEVLAQNKLYDKFWASQAIANKSYFGGSSFFCFEHKDVINVIKSKYKMRDDPREFKILEAKGESMLIMDLFLKKVELSKAPESTPRIKIIGIYRYNQNIWIKQ